MKVRSDFILCLLLALMLLNLPLIAEVTVSPLGFSYFAEEGAELDGAFALTNTGDNVANFQIGIAALQWEDDDDQLAPPRDDRGGPDDMEMEWRDSDEADCPPYSWIDITEFEDVIDVQNLADDSFHGMYELGFEFPYYGEVYDEIGFHTNGYACFWDASAIVFFWPGWEPLPNANPGAEDSTPPPNLLAVNSQDLDPLRSGEIFFWTNGENMAIVSWVDIAHFFDVGQEDGDLWTFQIILTANGLIKYQYASEGSYDNVQDMMIGLQNEDRDFGFTVAFDRDIDYIEEGRVVAFGPPGAWITWLDVDNVEGEIAAGEEAEINFVFDLEEAEEGINYAGLTVGFPGSDQPSVFIPVIISYGSAVGAIEGVVTDADGDAPMSDVQFIMEPTGYTLFTDEDGYFIYDNLPPGTYSLTACYGEYFDFVLDDIEVEADQTFDASLAMLHAEFNPSADEFIEILGPDDETEIGFTVTNGGNATVTYTSEKRLVGDANAAPWELRSQIMATELTDDVRLQGVAFVDGMYYVSGYNDGDPQIWILNANGELEGQFSQMNESRYGMKDIAWDGEWLWGSGEDAVIAFDREGEEMARFEGPWSPNNILTWDPDNQLLWVATTTNNIVAYDREGNRQEELELNRSGMRMYGLAYYPDDPDGYNMYVIHKIADVSDQYITKINMDNNDTMNVADLNPVVEGDAGGCFITNQYDAYSWVFLECVNDGANDRIDIWQIEARRDWLSVAPEEGEIEAGGEQEFTVTLNASDMVPEEYNGEFVFTHDGFDREVIIPVLLSVRLGRVEAERQIPLSAGWNMVSANLQPEPADDIRAIMQELVNDDNLLLMKNGVGEFYNPEFDFTNIDRWNVWEGYLVKTDRAGFLNVAGVTVLPDDPIDLFDGWQMISYYPRVAIDAIVAFSGIADQLTIAKNGAGHFYNPEWEFSNMGNLREGQGYQVKMDGDAELIYRLRMQDDGLNSEWANHGALPTKMLPQLLSTGRNMSLLAIANGMVGEIAVYASDKLVGTGRLDNGRCGVAVWGNDPSTDAIDGARDGDVLSIRLFNEAREQTASIATLTGSLEYQTDAFTVVDLKESTVPAEFGLTSAYPNPFNNRTTINFALPEAARVELGVYDLSGRRVMTLAGGEMTAGRHNIAISAEDLSSGVYVVSLKANGMSSRMKIALVK